MLEITKNRVIDSILTELKQVSNLIWERGWAEANAGNFSIDITDSINIKNLKIKNSGCEYINSIYSNIKNRIFLVSGSGSKMREIAINPITKLCIVLVNEKGNGYYNFPLDLKKSNRPTSEVLAHLEIHDRLRQENKNENVVLHTHPTEVIALTQIKKFCNEKSINRLLYSIQPEVSFVFPDGIGFIKYYLTGSEKLAKATGEKFSSKRTVIWEKHGLITSGKSLFDAFDKTEVLVKSLKIYFLCNSAGNKAEGISVNGIKELNKLLKKND